MAAKYRLKFTKQGNMRFVGHLDLLRLFQRAVKRAGVPVAYSQGFNPHQLMSFALPLSLGMAGSGEVVDIELCHAMPPGELAARLGPVMPNGVDILKCRMLAADEKAAAAELRAAEYAICFPEELEIAPCLERIIEAKEITVRRKAETAGSETDIRPDILSLALAEDGALRALLSAGGRRNVKPELLAAHMCGLMGVPYEPLDISYCRMEMYRMVDEQLESLY